MPEATSEPTSITVREGSAAPVNKVPTLPELLPGILSCLSQKFAGVECQLSRCPDLTVPPYDLSFKTIGTNLKVISDEGDSADPENVTLLGVYQGYRILSNSDPGQGMRITLRNNNPSNSFNWKPALKETLAKKFGGPWEIFCLEVIDDVTQVHLLNNGTPTGRPFSVVHIWLFNCNHVEINTVKGNGIAPSLSNANIPNGVVKSNSNVIGGNGFVDALKPTVNGIPTINGSNSVPCNGKVTMEGNDVMLVSSDTVPTINGISNTIPNGEVTKTLIENGAKVNVEKPDFPIVNGTSTKMEGVTNNNSTESSVHVSEEKPKKKVIRKVKATNPDGTPKKRIVKKKPAESKEANEVVQEVSEDLSSVSYVVRLGQHPAPDGVSLSDKEISPETLDLKDVGDIKDLKEVKGPEDHAHLLQSTSTNPSDNNTSICSELPPKSQSSSSIASSQSSSSTATVIAKSGSSTQINNGSSSSLSSVTTPTVNGHVSMKSTEPSVNGVQSTLTSTCTTVPETSNCLNNENSNVNGVEKDVTLKGETDRSIDAMNTTLNEAATVKKESESVLNRASYFDKPLNRDSPESGLNGTTSNGHSSGQECIPQNETGHLSNGVGLRSSSSELSSNSRPNVQDKSAAKTEPRKNGFHERHLSDRRSSLDPIQEETALERTVSKIEHALSGTVSERSHPPRPDIGHFSNVPGPSTRTFPLSRPEVMSPTADGFSSATTITSELATLKNGNRFSLEPDDSIADDLSFASTLTVSELLKPSVDRSKVSVDEFQSDSKMRGMTNVPVIALQLVLSTMSYKDLCFLRRVHPHWDELCGQLLNAGYYELIHKADILIKECQRRVIVEDKFSRPLEVLTNLQVHVLNPVDVLRAAMDEGVLCFPYGQILDQAFILLDRIEEVMNIPEEDGDAIPLNWEKISALSKKAQVHYRRYVEPEVEKRMTEVHRITNAQSTLQRIDSFLVESSVSRLEQRQLDSRDELRWDMDQLKEQNNNLKKDNRELKKNCARLEGRIEALERKFKTMARLLQS